MPVTDALGQSFDAAGENARIASLVPSLTETLIALGLQQQLVARTGFCVHPRAEVRAIPKVGGTKDVRLDLLRALAPTHVLLNVDENTRETEQALRAFVPHVIVTHPQTPQDNLELFALLGAAFGKVPQVAQRAGGLQHALHGVLDELAVSRLTPRQMLYLIWREPWMTVARDTYISRTLALVGWHTLPDQQGGSGLHQPGAARYPQFDWSAPWLEAVDGVLLSSEPYRFGAAHVEQVRALLAPRGLHPEVRCLPGEWASWYGVRAIDGLRQLAAAARNPA